MMLISPGAEPTESTSVKAWPVMNDDHRTFYLERCSVLEYEGGLSRDAAERVALIETRRHFRRLNGRAAA